MSSVEAAEAIAELNPDLQGFFARFPCDERAVKLLASSSEEVQDRVMAYFKAPREGEADYSALMMSFVKTTRAEAAGGFQDMSADIEALRVRYPFDEDAFNYLMNSGSDVQAAVCRDFKPKNEGEADYSALVIKFTKKLRTSVKAWGGGLGRAAQEPIHGQSRAAPAPTPEEEDALVVELDDFRGRYPMDEAAHNYLTNCPYDVLKEVLRDFRPKTEGEADYSAILISFAKKRRTHVAYGFNGGGYRNMSAELDAFRQRYPLDEDSTRYLLNASEDVQWAVINEFKPSREGQADYSALVIAFTKRMKQKILPGRGFGGPSAAYAPPPPPPMGKGGYGGAGHYGGPDAYGKGGYSGPPARPQPYHSGAGKGGYGGPRGGGYGGGIRREVDNFLRRYPVDERAQGFLDAQPDHVLQRLLQEFRPRREGDADYSAVVTSFTKRIAGAGGGGGYTPPGGYQPPGGGYDGPPGGGYHGPPGGGGGYGGGKGYGGAGGYQPPPPAPFGGGKGGSAPWQRGRY